MGITLFVLGCILFIISNLLIIKWAFIDQVAEDYFYRSYGCTILSVSLIFFFFFFGKTIFDNTAYNWIIIISAMLGLIMIGVFIFGYLYDGASANFFEARLLLFFIPIICYVLLILFFFGIDVITPIFNFLRNLIHKHYISIIVTLIIILSNIILSFFVYRKTSRTSNFWRFRITNDSISTFESDLFHYSKSNKRRIDLDEAILKIYSFAQQGTLSPHRVYEVLSEADVPKEISYKVIERIFDSGLDKYSHSISLLDFAQEVLPEFYRSRKSSRNTSMDIRMYEDFYQHMRFLLERENKDVIDLSQKIDLLLDMMVEKLPKGEMIQSATKDDESGCQNQIRELFHAIETPLVSTELATTNLRESFDSLDDNQKNKFSKILDNLKLIKSILYAYRELSFMTMYSDSNTFLPLPKIITSIPQFLSDDYQSIKLTVNALPDRIPMYSSNLVTVLLLPLIQNALEASPNKEVVVDYRITDENHIIQIINTCTKTPRQTDLEKDGYSSKPNNHIGTGISIVRRISKMVGIDFTIKAKNKKVKAILTLPIRKEDK